MEEKADDYWKSREFELDEERERREKRRLWEGFGE
jgi:hypothetical protein